MKPPALLTLILSAGLTVCIHFMLNRHVPVPPHTFAQADSTAATDSTSRGLTEEEFRQQYLKGPCNSESGIRMKIFVPDSSLTASMPVLDAPHVDEGMLIPHFLQPCIETQKEPPPR